MHHPTSASAKSIGSELIIYIFLIAGAFLAAFAIQVFLIPNRLIDGGIVGIAMVCANIFGTQYLGYFTFALNLPFVFLAYRYIGKVFVLHMFFALLFFTGFIFFIEHYMPWAEFKGETLEVVVIGGALLGIGIGLIIRYGGCLDGTEILGIISNRLTGFTVGQVVLVINIFVFSAAGIAFKDWHPPLLSLITYMVVSKIMDTVIVGLDETKSVIIISSKSEIIANAIVHELGLGLTIMYGRGGFSGDEREILYVIAERLQLADLKELIYREDPAAFIAIENLHEVANGNQTGKYKKTSMKELFSRMLSIKK
ncbi:MULTISPECIES: YitT family protein [unclassified Neochlamydia]|uniref:YitT family protein n=1 Tax=unclassified Neochlamydia TaxID=2643326 RepID=UPI00140B8E05|nr:MULTISPECIES: YitT family protein [unclassified Neochlamydia]